jgi:FdhE protein
MSTLQAKLKRIDQIRAKKPGFSDVMDFFEQIFIARDAVLQNVAVGDPYPDSHGIAMRLHDGFPLLEKRYFVYDGDVLVKYFYRLLDIVARRNPAGAEAIRARSATAEELLNNMPPQDIVKALAPFGGESDLMLFLLKECMRPWLERYAERLSPKVGEEQWHEGCCPVCGGFACFGEIFGQENQRRLFCQDCGASWLFPRLQCPFCNIDSHEKLEYFKPDGEPEYRVMLCRACKRYIKTADFREFSDGLVAEVEHPATLYLDIISRERGYKTEDVLTGLLL